jgi:hypothetical protein
VRHGVITLAALGLGCLQVDLAGHACPCVDGFVCVDDTCVVSDVTTPPCDQSNCSAPKVCVDNQCVDDDDPPPPALCPETFGDADTCATDPPTEATLLAVCDDGLSFPRALTETLGAALQFCALSGATATIASFDASGELDADLEGDPTEVTLLLDGSVVYDVDIPASCINAVAGCLPSDGSGTCVAAGDGCRCTGVEVPLESVTLEKLGDLYFSSDGTYVGCPVGDTFVLRQDSGGVGPILVFGAP